MCLSEPGFCGYIFQSPVCLAFCADSSCEEYFSTSLAAPLACFPCSFFGWRVCFFFVSVNIISSRPRSVETVVGRASDPSFSGTEHVCLCVLVWLLELSLFIYNIIWTWEKVFVLSWSDRIQYSLCIGNRRRLVLHVGVWKILCHSHLLCSLLSISKLYWTDNHGTKSTSVKSFVEFNTIDGKILDKGEAACCLSKLSHSEITATTPGSSSFSEAASHQFWKVVYN